MMTSARFRDGTLVTVCEKHHFRHEERAAIRVEMDQAEDAAYEALKETAHWDRLANAWRVRADDAIKAYQEAKSKLK